MLQSKIKLSGKKSVKRNAVDLASHELLGNSNPVFQIHFLGIKMQKKIAVFQGRSRVMLPLQLQVPKVLCIQAATRILNLGLLLAVGQHQFSFQTWKVPFTSYVYLARHGK
ncbi:hypothetical protein Nepgr_004415 [Nepenthes gracilis]|uniref:Uncharacterized protein n=1 Tax=Nepenthes gracilis TaxID=150966 RepID=A0AAD3S1D9_NEPGR|nr:hypothetical protein Nepgr_004415 [Nepenthes gracilis]